MQGGRGGRGRDNFFGFGDPFGSFNNHMSLTSSIFNGRDPFDDPFFTRPFGNMNSMFGLSPPSMFGPSLFDRPANTPFIDNNSNHNNNRSSRGVVIEEISSEGEEEGGHERREKSRKHARSGGGEVYVEEPDDEDGERRIRHMQHRTRQNDWVLQQQQQQQPQTRSFSFQSSSVTYGGANGAYYTSSTTRKMGDNGVMLEEKKEADTTTGKAEHRVSKGIHEKGHTVTRKLNPDGKVDTMQTLHNLNEDELAGFQETWKGNARKHLPGWTEGNNVLDNMGKPFIFTLDLGFCQRKISPNIAPWTLFFSSWLHCYLWKYFSMWKVTCLHLVLLWRGVRNLKGTSTSSFFGGRKEALFNLLSL